MKVGLTISAMILFGLLGSLCIVPPLHAQDLSRTPMRIEKDFALTVKLPVKLAVAEGPGDENDPSSRVYAIQDAQDMEMFLNCWNHPEVYEWLPTLVEQRIYCASLFPGTGWQEAFPPNCHQPEDLGCNRPSDTFEFRHSVWHGYPKDYLSVLTTTLVVVVNDDCIGAMLIPDHDAHGDVFRSVNVSALGFCTIAGFLQLTRHNRPDQHRVPASAAARSRIQSADGYFVVPRADADVPRQRERGLEGRGPEIRADVF